MSAQDRPETGSIARPHRLAISLLAGILLVWALAMTISLRQAALPDDGTGRMVVLFPLDWSEDAAFDAVLRADGFALRRAFSGTLWVVQAEDVGFVGRLKAAGAVAAFDSFAFDLVPLSGCFFLSTGRSLPFTFESGATS